MTTVKIVYWQDSDFWVGHFQDYLDYLSQGKTLEELKENLRDLYKDLTRGEIPGIRRVDELGVA